MDFLQTFILFYNVHVFMYLLLNGLNISTKQPLTKYSTVNQGIFSSASFTKSSPTQYSSIFVNTLILRSSDGKFGSFYRLGSLSLVSNGFRSF